MENFKIWLTKNYGNGAKATVNGISGMLYGNDECFEVNDFYQYFISDDGCIYQAYYDIDGKELDTIDYTQAKKLVDITTSAIENFID